MEKENSRKVRSSKMQIRMLVDYMVTHRNFANGEFSGPLGTQQYQAQWEQLSVALSEHGPQKSAEQWRTTWRDLKRRAREEGANFKKASSATGNTVVVPTISETSEKVLGIIGQEMAFGITNSEESGVGTLLTDTSSANTCSSNTFFEVPNTFVTVDEPLSLVSPPPPPATSSYTSTRPVTMNKTIPRLSTSNLTNDESLSLVSPPPVTSSCTSTRPMTMNRTTPRLSTSHVLTNASPITMGTSTPRPVSLPPQPAAPQRRVGLGERAAEFLAAEEATTGVLRDILNTFQSQNIALDQNGQIKRRQWIREERIRRARRY